MKIAFISNHNPANRIVRSGVPYSIYQQLSKYNDVIWIKPELRGINVLLYRLFKGLTYIDRLLGYTRNERLVCMDWVFKDDIERKLKGHMFDAIFTLGTQYLSTLNTNLPIFIRTDAIFHSFYNYYLFGLSKWSVRKACKTEERELSKVNTVFAASQWVLDEARKHVPEFADKFVFVETGANLEMDKIKIKKKEYSKELPQNALFIGFNVKRKGIDVALDAVRILNETYGIKTKLTVIGGRPEQSFLDSPYLDYKGLLDKNKPEEYNMMYEEFKNADFFIFPTRAECHGIVNCEAAAYALPIFSYDTGGVSSYVINDVNGVAFPLNATSKDFAEKIFSAISSGKMKAYSENSRNLFEKRFNWDVWGDKVNIHMREVVSRNKVSNDTKPQG